MQENPVAIRQLGNPAIEEQAARKLGLAWGATSGMLVLAVALSDPGLVRPFSTTLVSSVLAACVALMALAGLAAGVQSAVAISGEVARRTVDLVRLSPLSTGSVVYGYVVAAKRQHALLRWLLLGAAIGGWVSGGVLSVWMIGERQPEMVDWVINLLISLTVTTIPAILWYVTMQAFMQMATTAGVASGLVAANAEQAILKAVLNSGAGIGLLALGIGAALVVPWLLVVWVLGAALAYSKREEAIIWTVVRRWE